MTGWPDLGAELDRWGDEGRTATFWWRDDDAVAPTPALERLLGLSDRSGVAIALAVIPMAATAGLAARLKALPQPARPAVLIHGYAHRNRAASHEKKSEFPVGRATGDAVREIAAGLDRLVRLFGTAAQPWLVPPWNRLAPAIVPRLPATGLRGLSAFGRRALREPVAGLVQVNTHLDPIDWRGTRGFAGTERVLGTLVAGLQARRGGDGDGLEPTGLLSHHLVFDSAAWGFVERLLDVTGAHRAARWLSRQDLFETPEGAP